MDDILNSVDSAEKSKQLESSVTHILEQGGFKIKEWITSTKVSSSTRDPFPESTETYHRALGMIYDPASDSFKFRVKLNFSPKVRNIHSAPNLQFVDIPRCIPLTLNMRMILSQTKKINDPRGLLGPFTVRPKIMMKRLH